MRRLSSKDWGLLVCGLGATVTADYFLILRQEYLLGVAVFCFAHIFYILRAAGGALPPFSDCSVDVLRSTQNINLVGISPRSLYSLLLATLLVWLLGFTTQSLPTLAILYAFLFALNIYVNLKSRLPKPNYRLVLAGLIFFALCDVNVLLFNLPAYFGLPDIFPSAFRFIWFFYLPSQAFIAASGLRIENTAAKDYTHTNTSY
ncbi:MAG: lysoplasmalogenase family protein [Defluviitaleaceae bacterium]|nr:lysoplasmalogenase family protein [Defluviitaleaceae bacterium]